MKLHFLQAPEPLTKTYTKTANGVVKTPYPMTWEFTSHEEVCNNLSQFEHLLKKHAAANNCLLKGTLQHPLVSESRAGSTDRNAATEWVVLDLDGLPETMDMQTPSGQVMTVPLTVDLFLQEMGLSDVSYIIQWSASYGIENNRMRAHIFMMLDKPCSAPLLKQWLMQKNHELPVLSGAMTLAKSGNTLCWPLDVSACQNDKLIYIAPPRLKGIKDPMGKEPRIQLVKRKYEKLSLQTSAINSTEKNKSLTHKRIDEIRAAQGLPKRKYAYKVVGGAEVMLKPDEAIVTEMKVDRGFVYFNLNGGDSWAYYHPENNPDYIHNFKGEPSYLTKELLPGYWQELMSSGLKTSSAGITYLAFCDRASGVYWRGTYDNANDDLQLYQAKNETQLRHFAKQHGVPLGDFIPEWDLTFDPHDNVRVDEQNRTVNLFLPTVYMKTAPKKVRTIPRTIMKVMHHALGSDAKVTEHFVNWLAYIVQKRDRTRTAWVLHGRTGTGKGILMNKVLRPIFGEKQTATRRMEELNEQFNTYMRNAFIVFVDEVETKALANERGAMAKIKNFITEPIITLRAMHQNGQEINNYTNWIFSSNRPDPIVIDREDRRMNVGKYQPESLQITQAEIDSIAGELQAFYDYLVQYPLDEVKATTVLQTEDRDILMSISESSVDTAVNALLAGDFNFFIEQLPSNTAYQRNALTNNKVEDYKDTLKTLMQRTDSLNGKCAISRDELHVLLDYVVGGMPTSPNKFTSLLKHHRLHLEVVWINKATRGLKTTWQDCTQFSDYQKDHFQAASSPSPTKKAKSVKP
jgi:hypothetical protein